MGWTKRQLVEEAYAELALAGYTFDRSPEEDERACRRLDAMMAFWDYRGIRVGYFLAASPADTSLDSESGLPLYAAEPVFLSLACRLCSGAGKSPPPLTLGRANEGYALLMRQAAEPVEMQHRSTMPSGAGNKRRGPFMPPPNTAPLQVDGSGDLDFL